MRKRIFIIDNLLTHHTSMHATVLASLFAALLELFRTHRRDARVILPLLKTLDILVSHRCLDDLILDGTSPFRESLLELLAKEAKNCSDVHRLFACIDVALGLVSDGTTASSGGEHVSKVEAVVSGLHISMDDKSQLFHCCMCVHWMLLYM